MTEEAVAQAEAGGEMPLDFLLSIMRDEAADETKRIDCAKAAAPYLHAKLANIEVSGNADAPLVHEIRRTVVRPGD